MPSTTIYFPRMNQSYRLDVPQHLSACATWLSYTGADARYISLLNLARGGSFPFMRDDRYFFEELAPEKTMAHLLGIYYEEFFFDSLDSLQECTLRNLKMRIVAPILFLKGSTFGVPNVHDIAVVACGFQKDHGSIVAINPSNGAYFEVSLDAYAEFHHQTKMVMFNVPGMSKIAQLDVTSIAVRAIRIYLRRFYCYGTTYFAKAIGLGAWKTERMRPEDKQAYLSHIHTQLAWFEEAENYKHLLNEMEQKKFDRCVIYYRKALEGF